MGCSPDGPAAIVVSTGAEPPPARDRGDRRRAGCDRPRRASSPGRIAFAFVLASYLVPGIVSSSFRSEEARTKSVSSA